MSVDSRTVAVAAAWVLVTIALGALAGRTAGVAAGVIAALVGLVGSAVATVVLEKQSRQAAVAARHQELLEMFAPPRPSEDGEGGE
jgi:membrane associated rhomboid family serine protease